MNAHENQIAFHDAVHVDSCMHATHAILYEADEGGYAAVAMDGSSGLSGPGRPPARVRRRFTETGDGKRHRTKVVHWVEHATVYEINDGVYSVVATNEEVGRVEPLQALTRTRKVSANIGNGGGHRPRLWANVVVALGRDEQLGRSWRGSKEGG